MTDTEHTNTDDLIHELELLRNTLQGLSENLCDLVATYEFARQGPAFKAMDELLKGQRLEASQPNDLSTG